MKKLLLLFVIFISFTTKAQTAANFNVNDCAATNHDLFTELNSGKIVVLVWVMPCSNCALGATSAQNAVQSFSISHPGQVVYYIADDYANSTCAVVNSWCSSNNIMPDAVFSNTAVSMTPYGASGMPKAIVIGGSSHTVYYNVNGSGNITTSNIQTAISNAIAAPVGIKSSSAAEAGVKLSPNPVNNELTLTFGNSEKLSVEIYSIIGEKVRTIENVNGNKLKINTESFNNGAYFAKITDGKNNQIIKFIIAH